MKKIIEEFETSGGKHCITHALKQVFTYYGHPLSEAMLFGIGEGLDFTYINLAHAPMVSGRCKVLEMEHTLANAFGIQIICRQSKLPEVVFKKTKAMLDQNEPVLVYVDMPYLDYLGLNENSHFGGHAVVIFGYDDEKQCFYVSDRDHSDFPIRTPKGNIAQDYHCVSYAEMELARGSNHRPFPANFKYLQFSFDNYQGIQKEQVKQAIINTCNRMLHPEAKLKGVHGITKFANEMKSWAKFDPSKRKNAGITNYFQISKDGGTGGGIFRHLFGEFLQETYPYLHNDSIYEIGSSFIMLSKEWDTLANLMWELGTTGDITIILQMKDFISSLQEKEVSLLQKLQDTILM